MAVRRWMFCKSRSRKLHNYVKRSCRTVLGTAEKFNTSKLLT